jgi:hypothetical protein
MSQTSITLTVNADTAAALARMEEFFKRSTEGVNELAGASRFLTELGEKIAGVFAVGALVEFTREAINTAAALDILSKQTGLAIQTLAGLRGQAIANGVPFEELTASLGIFSQRIFMAVQQGGTMNRVFRDLAISIVDANGNLRSNDAILSDVADRFSKMADGAQKSAAAAELFGRAGRQLIPILNEGAEGMSRMREEGGGITPELVANAVTFKRSVAELKEEFEGIFFVIANQILPKLKEMTDNIRAAVSEENIKGTLLTVVMEVTKLIGDAFINMISLVVHGMVNAVQIFADMAVGALNKIMAMIRKIPGFKNAENVERLDLSGASDQYLKSFDAELGKIESKWNSFISRGMSASKIVFGNKPAGSGSAPLGANQGFEGEYGSGGAGPAPVSEAAKQIIEQVNAAYAEATKGKLAALDEEEKKLKEKIDDEILNQKTAEEEKTKVTEIFSRKRIELIQKEKDAQAALAFAQVEQQRKSIESNPLLTDTEKAQQLIPVLQAELSFANQMADIEQRRSTDPNLSAEAKLLAEQEAVKFKQQQVELERELQSLQGRGSFSFQFSSSITDMISKSGTIAQQAAQTFRNSWNTAIDSISNGLTKVIMGTERWSQALRDIGSSILNAIIGGIIKMFVTWIANMIILRALQKLFHADTSSEAQQSAAAWTPAATAASIASYGAAALTGTAATIAGIGIATAFATGLAASGYSEGGYTGPGGKHDVAGVVHAGEWVVPADRVSQIGLGPLQALNAGASPKAISGGSQPINQAIHFWTEKSALAAWIKDNPDVHSTVIDFVRRSANTIPARS